MHILTSPVSFRKGGGYNDKCIVGPIYGVTKNNYILYENTGGNRHRGRPKSI